MLEPGNAYRAGLTGREEGGEEGEGGRRKEERGKGEGEREGKWRGEVLGLPKPFV